ncbi:MAG: GNAT family N-acetyltransferase [Clostridia bacterium]|nr:GNAT family N-acetyltransferase [Clostridia bacterium]
MFFDTVIFDFDYTLADGTDAIVACYNYAFSKHGYPDGEREAVRRTVGKTVRDSIRELTGCNDLQSIEDMRLLFREKADEILAKQTYLYNDTVPMLNLLKEKGIKIAIVSSKEKIRIEESLGIGGADGLIDLIIGVSSAPEPKPSPVGVKMAMGELLAEKALYVGDSLIDFETAKNAGLPFAAVTTGTTAKDDFILANSDGAVNIFGIFESLTELTKSLFKERTLYVTDIDGTLKEGREAIDAKKKELLNKAADNGVLFTAATARGVSSALCALDGIKLTAPLITLSGVEYYNAKSGRLKRYPLPEKTAVKIEKEAFSLGLEVFCYKTVRGDKTLYIYHRELKSDSARRFKDMRSKVNGQLFCEKSAFPLSENEDIVYLVVIGDENAVLKLENTALQSTEVATERFSESGTGVCYLEIFSKEGGKGNAAERIKNEVFADRVVAFGDNLNDLSFKSVSDELYTVESGLSRLKQSADGVLKNGCVADFIASRAGVCDGIEISLATAEDIPYIEKLERRFFAEAYGARLLLKALESESSYIITAKEFGAVSGYIIADVYADFAEIDKILTLPSCRGRGIAKRLHKELVKTALEKGSEKILLEVRSKNSARAFYEKLGYTVDGVRKNYYRDDDAVLMSLKIK